MLKDQSCKNDEMNTEVDFLEFLQPHKEVGKDPTFNNQPSDEVNVLVYFSQEIEQ